MGTLMLGVVTDLDCTHFVDPFMPASNPELQNDESQVEKKLLGNIGLLKPQGTGSQTHSDWSNITLSSLSTHQTTKSLTI